MLEDIRVLLFRWAICPMGLCTMKVGGGGVNRKFFTNTKIKPQTKNNNKTENKKGKFANLENPQLLL